MNLAVKRVVTVCTIHISDEQEDDNKIERLSEENTIANVLGRKKKRENNIAIRYGLTALGNFLLRCTAR